ncbi:MATE family efflux transporter [Dysosmobacter sp.]|uniref:MATE family efflux transporter n=1 Tax=Dysosmobacter sp. TaxID=2591382 RepID=UPI0026733FA2|nr:MATE family efflux transporter [Dysosmobacter sp.]MCI7282621.1 MATE family efflux transporter [Dysosmobacter sp.]
MVKTEGIPVSLSRQVFQIAWPAALEALLVGVVDLVDMAMVSSLKLTAVSAVGVTSQPKRILLMFTLALNVAATALVSRRIGAGEKKEANHCMHQFLWISIFMALVLYALGFLLAAPLMKLSGANSETLGDAVDYFRILVIGQIPQAVSLTINACLRAEGKTRVTLLTNTAANVVNLIFNYFLIQGNCGFPRLAVKGAAIATTMGSFAAFLISLYSIRRKNGGILHLDLKGEPCRPDLPLLKGAWKVAFSAFHEQFFQRLGIFAFARIAASLGTVEFAIYQFIMNLANLQGYTYDGFASAATALTGQSLGMKEPERARQTGKYAVWMGYATAGFIALSFALFRHPILSVFAKGDHYVIQHGGALLLFVAVSCIPCSGSTVYAGILRGAGDTRAVARITLWVVAVLRPVAAWLFCYPLKLYQYGIWASFTLAHTLRWICLYLHWRKGCWTQIEL